jgi:hypothetical protein
MKIIGMAAFEYSITGDLAIDRYRIRQFFMYTDESILRVFCETDLLDDFKGELNWP